MRSSNKHSIGTAAARLHSAIRGLTQQVVTEMQVPRAVWGVVTAVSPEDATLSFAPQGSTNSLDGLSYRDGYIPSVNDVAVAFAVGTDLWVLGTMAVGVPSGAILDVATTVADPAFTTTSTSLVDVDSSCVLNFVAPPSGSALLSVDGLGNNSPGGSLTSARMILAWATTPSGNNPSAHVGDLAFQQWIHAEMFCTGMNPGDDITATLQYEVYNDPGTIVLGDAGVVTMKAVAV